jgi:hypothetical protein
MKKRNIIKVSFKGVEAPKAFCDKTMKILERS